MRRNHAQVALKFIARGPEVREGAVACVLSCRRSPARARQVLRLLRGAFLPAASPSGTPLQFINKYVEREVRAAWRALLLL